MGYDLLAAILFVALTPFVLAGFILFWTVNARDHEELAASWRGYARKRELTFVEPEGDWPNRTAPGITWNDDGTELRLSAVGREARVRTRLSIKPRCALLGTFSVLVRESGDPEVIRERPAAFTQRVVSDRVRRALLGFRQRDRITLGSRRGRITLEWASGEQNHARLDEARRVAAEIARAIDEQFHAAARAAA